MAGNLVKKHRLLALMFNALRGVDTTWSSREFLELSDFHLSCNQNSSCAPFLFEVAAALRIQAVQDALISTHGEIGTLLKEFNQIYVEAGVPLQIGHYPIISTFVTTANELVAEGRQLSEIVANESWLDILHLPFD